VTRRGENARTPYGFCDQEAPQAHVEEEASQAASSYPRAAAQTRQVSASAPRIRKNPLPFGGGFFIAFRWAEVGVRSPLRAAGIAVTAASLVRGTLSGGSDARGGTVRCRWTLM